MSDDPSAIHAFRNHSGSPDSLASKLENGTEEEVADAVFEGWEGTYGDGRRMLLERVRAIRALLPPQQRDQIGRRLFRLLVTVGEESGDMRFVHLAVESRDLILYGY